MKERRRRVGGWEGGLVGGTVGSKSTEYLRMPNYCSGEFLSGWCVCVVRMSTCTCVLSIYPRPLIFAGVNQPYRRVHRTLVPQGNMTRFARTTRHLTPPSYRWFGRFSKLQFYSKKWVLSKKIWFQFNCAGCLSTKVEEIEANEEFLERINNLWPEIRIHSPNQMIDQLWHILKSK